MSKYLMENSRKPLREVSDATDKKGSTLKGEITVQKRRLTANTT